MNISARNQIKGKITDIQKSSVNAIVKIDIGVATLLVRPFH